MEAFQFFGFWDYLFVVIICIAAIVFYVWQRNKLSKRKEKSPAANFGKTGIILLVFGVVLIAVAVAGFIKLNMNAAEVMEILQPVFYLTTKVYTLLEILFFVFGISIIAIGLKRVKMVN